MNVETEISQRLEGIYSTFRKLQSAHDTFETACNGTGNCCKVGLRISLAECFNIARNLKRKYWLIAEDDGKKSADFWWDALVSDLYDAFDEPDWQWNNEDSVESCVFYKGGCTIYEYRPAICRAYGVISPVQEGVCGRPRLPDGNHELIRNGAVESLVAEFDKIIADWGEAIPDSAFSIYMPAGVLRFLLGTSELQDLISNTDPKFWMGTPGYPHQMGKIEGVKVEIR